MLVRRALEGSRTDRLPVLIRLGTYAARVNQMSYRQLTGDPTTLANALQSAQRLFGCDGFIILADTTLGAEAFGCTVEWENDDECVIGSHPYAGEEPIALPLANLATPGRAGVVVEATRRLEQVIGKEVAVVPAVTGPVTLAAHLRGPAFLEELAADAPRSAKDLDAAVQLAVHLAKEYFVEGLDMMILHDPMLAQVSPERHPQIKRALGTLWNVAEFYDAVVVIASRIAPDVAESVLTVGGGGVLVEGDPVAEQLVAAADRRGQVVGAALPGDLLRGSPADVEAAVGRWRASSTAPFAVLMTIDRDVSPENVHAAVRALRAPAGGA